MVCDKRRIKKVQYCAGDLKYRITLKNRSLDAPRDNVDFDEDFSDEVTVWAGIKTVNGKTIFDDTNTERDISHEFIIRFREGISNKTWIEYNGDNYDIVKAENVNEQNDWLRLQANIRGKTTKKASRF